jgi:hypothetical protein
MTTTDRLAGLNGSVGFKAPCRVATTAAITLSGEQTIDGVAIVANDRVLVKNQASGVDNGIYIASTGAWSRALDFDGARDARNGTLVFVTSGSANGLLIFRMAATDPYTAGTGSSTWTSVANLDADTAATAAALSASNSAASAAAAAASAVTAATFNPAAFVEVAGDTMTGTLNATVSGSMTGTVIATTLNGGQLAGLRNVLINGGMQISQRNGTSATSTNDDVYHLDRWYALTETASITVTQQSLGENGTPYHCRLTQSQASPQRMGMAQIVEAANSYPLRGSAVTLSARIRCSNSQAIRYAVLEWTGTADSVTSDVVNTWSSGTYTAGNFFLGSNVTVTATGVTTPAASTWTTITALNATLGSSTNNIIVLFWTEGTASQNVTLDIGRVQLEPGTVATPFEWRGIGAELSLCQRYYYAAGAAQTFGFPCPSTGGFAVQQVYHFPVRMRIAPVSVSGASTISNISSFGSTTSTTDSFQLQVVGTTSTNSVFTLNPTATAEL